MKISTLALASAASLISVPFLISDAFAFPKCNYGNGFSTHNKNANICRYKGSNGATDTFSTKKDCTCPIPNPTFSGSNATKWPTKCESQGGVDGTVYGCMQ